MNLHFFSSILLPHDHSGHSKKYMKILASIEESKQCIRTLKKEKHSPERTQRLQQQCARIRLAQLQLHHIAIPPDREPKIIGTSPKLKR